jgi:hypothetical protein
MAPVLKCPDCGEKHPVTSVPSTGAFPCRGCGRVLKVPEVAKGRSRAVAPRTAPAAPAAPADPAAPATPPPVAAPRPVPIATAISRPSAAGAPAAPADSTATRAVPEVDKRDFGSLPRPSRRPVARLGRVPWWMRFLLWVVAVPLSFLLVFLVARTFSVFTTNQLSDLFLANNVGRFWPVARLLPFVALVTASLVHGGVYLLARMRGRKGGDAANDLSGSVNRPRGR